MIEQNREIVTPDFNLIKKSADSLKEVLKTFFGKVYLEKKDIGNSNESQEIETVFSLKIFTVDKEMETIYKTIDSVEELKKVKKEILEKYESIVVNSYWKLVDAVENELDDDSIKTLEIIGNNFAKKQKKIAVDLKKFIVDDSWNIDRIQKEFSYVLQKTLRDLLDSAIDPIANGMKNTGFSVYDETIIMLNNFLKELGVYTKEYHPGDKFTDDDLDQYLSPRTAEDSKTTDKSLQQKIRDVESVAYLFEKDVVIREANIVVWKVS